MEFCFMRAGKPIIAAGAFALLASVAMPPVMVAQAPSQPAAGAGQAGQSAQPGQAGQAGQAPAKNYKDRDEYDLYSKITQTTDPKAKLQLLQTWQDKYPQSDFASDRDTLFMLTLSQLAPNDPASRQKLVDKAGEIAAKDPKNFRANYMIALWGPAVGGTSPAPDLLAKVDTAAHGVIDGSAEAFDASKKPANVSEADFQKFKGQAVAIAHNALAWEATSKKDNAAAEAAYKASLEANPEQSNIAAAFGKMLITEKKYPEGLFEYARAATYDGPGALPPATRTQLLDYFNKAYKDFHGSDEGKQQMLDQAKTSAVPPSGLQVTSAADLANKQADAMNARIGSDPGFKI